MEEDPERMEHAAPPDNQNLRRLTPILADISLTYPLVGNAANRDQWGTY
jgi:hypothetical protein